MEEDIDVSLLIVGKIESGKTCLAIRYSLSEYPQNYIPTVLENFKKDVVIDNTFVKLKVWDSTFFSDYSSFRPIFYKNKQIILLCFGIDNRDTFEEAKNEYIEMKKYNKNVPFILVGLKSDLRKELELSTSNFVTFDEALQCAIEIKAESYVECSALDGTNVNWLFEYATQVGLSYSTENNTKNIQNSCVVC
ncbi:GTP-binding protein Rho1 [Entamoeba marina]